MVTTRRCSYRALWAMRALLAVALAALLGLGLAAPGDATTFHNWSGYLNGAGHSSFVAANTSITRSNAASLVKAWTFTPDTPPVGALGHSLFSSPTVVAGRVYIGANNGTFYALDEQTGKVVWKRFIGYVIKTTCGWHGFVSTATVANDPTSGKPTVYVAGPDGYLYALDASDGKIVWRSVIAIPSTSVNDYFNWSSPSVFHGRIYVGVASNCDIPLIQGGLLDFDQASGHQVAVYHTVPNGTLGGSIWSSAAVSSRSVYVSTGNGPDNNKGLGDSLSIVKLSATDLHEIARFQIPKSDTFGDTDFGGSPTLFSATVAGHPTWMVGACNKNGKYYALNSDSLAKGPVWTLQVGAKSMSNSDAICIAAAVTDGTHLFLAGNATTIGGKAFNGSIRQVDPATGKVRWATGLPGPVDGTPTLNGSGILSVATFDFSGAPNADYLLDANTGHILATLDNGNSAEFAQPVLADNFVFLATVSAGLTAYRTP